MKETLEVKAPRGKLIVKPLEVKTQESTILLPDAETDPNSGKKFEYHPYQAEVIVVGEDSHLAKSDYVVGDILLLRGLPRNAITWNKEKYYVIDSSGDIIGWIPKSVKGKLQHIYKK